MKRTLIGLAALALSAQLAFGQSSFNYIVPNAPAGSNNNQAASTAFVMANAVGGGAVASVFGRAGAVVSAPNDYNFNQLAGTNSAAQIGGSAASHAVPVDVAGTPTWKVIPDCQNTVGNHLNFTQSTDTVSCGASTLGTSGLSVLDYGATDDNLTDNRTAVQNAINAAQAKGATLYFPSTNTGVYLFTTGFNASAVLSITAPIRLVCAPGVWLKPSAAITNAQSILYFTGTTTLELLQSKTIIDGCNIGDPASTTRFGNHGIVFDTTGNINYKFVMPIVQNLTIGFANIDAHGCWSFLEGCAIFVDNNSVNTAGGTYGAIFQNCICAGGINFTLAGDSNAVRNVFFPPDLSDPNVSNQGVYASLIAGAGGLLIDNVNCQALNGCLAVDNATNVIVKNPNFEQISLNGENNSAMVDLGSGIKNITAYVGPVVFQGGNITASDCTNHPFLITFNAVQGGYFSGLRLSANCATYPHALVSLTASSTNVGIGVGNLWLLNNGVLTVAATKYANSGTNNYLVTTGVP